MVTVRTLRLRSKRTVKNIVDDRIVTRFVIGFAGPVIVLFGCPRHEVFFGGVWFIDNFVQIFVKFVNYVGQKLLRIVLVFSSELG